jgi:ribosomal protein L32
MAVPKRRMSKMKGRQRRSHYHAIKPTLGHCPGNHLARPHSVCPICHTYRGRLFAKPSEMTSAESKDAD